MTSKDYTIEALSTTLRALNTMEGLIEEAQEPIPSNILEDEAPADVKNGENLGATFAELELLREEAREIINAIILLYDDDLGAPAMDLLDGIGKNEANINKWVNEILEKYDGDTVSDEY